MDVVYKSIEDYNPNKKQKICIDFQDFMNLYKKCTAKSYSFWVIDTTFPSDIKVNHDN